jgi:transcriptional regulator with XRE-family HTH domain
MELGHFGEYIRCLRRKKGWNQAVVANALQISIAAYSNIENGKTDINLSRLFQVSEVFRVTTDKLLSNQFKLRNCKLVVPKDEVKYNLDMIISLQNKIIKLHEELSQFKTS